MTTWDRDCIIGIAVGGVILVTIVLYAEYILAIAGAIVFGVFWTAVFVNWWKRGWRL